MLDFKVHSLLKGHPAPGDADEGNLKTLYPSIHSLRRFPFSLF